MINFKLIVLYFASSSCFSMLYQVVEQYLCICVFLHWSVHLATSPAHLSPYFNKLQWNFPINVCQNRRSLLKMLTVTVIILLMLLFRRYFLLSRFYIFPFVAFYFYICLTFQCSFHNWPYSCCASTSIII
jgi:hypothetical protein